MEPIDGSHFPPSPKKYLHSVKYNVTKYAYDKALEYIMGSRRGIFATMPDWNSAALAAGKHISAMKAASPDAIGYHETQLSLRQPLSVPTLVDLLPEASGALHVNGNYLIRLDRERQRSAYRHVRSTTSSLLRNSIVKQTSKHADPEDRRQNFAGNGAYRYGKLPVRYLGQGA
ncbi:unnamed protein product [Zymoseptoria tritici ST99CH_1A5]|uniref:Uncharacterized protein n=1 Tax=Zymoseptoria tritici ST99CH_1A5 TaxID=1276529 RepID=A0A1Y6L797_ZYMTR|nr:unnamed protein product [Zymoseptoria tritici ST99CH_1A5]